MIGARWPLIMFKNRTKERPFTIYNASVETPLDDTNEAVLVHR